MKLQIILNVTDLKMYCLTAVSLYVKWIHRNTWHNQVNRHEHVFC